MKLISIGFLLALSSDLLAQTTTSDPSANLRLNNPTNPMMGTLLLRTDTRYEGQRGTPYLLTNWAKGQIDLTNGKQYMNVSLKFDAYHQNLIMLRPQAGNDSIIVDRQTVSRFLLTSADGQPFLFGRYPTAKLNDEDVKNGYFLILYEGKLSFLKRVAKTFNPADYKGAYSSDVRYDAYTDAISYYILKPDQTLTKVKLSKKALLEVMSDKEAALKAFIDQEKFTFKTEADAALLVKQYDSL